MPPTIIFINGLPATGKSTLAGKLGAALRLPVFGKDQIKETLFDTLGWGERAWSRKLGAASMAVLFRMLENELVAGRSCIAESNFHPELSTQQVQELRQRYQFGCIQVLCVTDGNVLQQRYRARVANNSRHPGHMDAILEDELAGELRTGRVDPMQLDGPLIEIDTTHVRYADIRALRDQLAALLGASGQPAA